MQLPAFVPVRRRAVFSSVASVPGCLRSLPRASTIGRAGSDNISVGLLNARSIANKSFALNDLFTSKDLDFLFITETWQKTEEFAALNELCPPDCSYSCVPRTTGRGGGLAIINRDGFSTRSVSCGTFSTFEVSVSKVGRANPFYCILIYRPPGRNANFITDFGHFLASIIRFDRVLMVGDFNVHVNDSSDSFAVNFLNVTESFNFTQHVSGPTHAKGNTLDLVFTTGLKINSICTEELTVSDHYCVLFNTLFDNDVVLGKRVKCSRVINSLTANKFASKFDSNIVNPSHVDIDLMVNSFNTHCSSILDEVAPMVTRKLLAVNHSPWLNENIYNFRRKCRKVERLWKSTHLQVHRLYLKDLMSEYNNMVRDARAAYFSDIITSSKHNPSILFKTINNIVSSPLPPIPVFSNEDCNDFLLFFVNKVADVRASISPSLSPLPTCPARHSTLNCFAPISLQDLIDIVNSMKRSSSPLDVIPTSILKEAINSVGPGLVSIINFSLESGSVPSYFKQAVVEPLLKKPNLDPSLPKNYRPISKLPFTSKVLEKVVANQLNAFLANTNTLDKFQSGFRTKHSTETALLRVSNDILMAADSGECAVLIMLDLSAAFDTVDHSIMLDRLREWVGISGRALDWFSSYLGGRSFSVAVGPFTSDPAPLPCGVPQGSILAPLLWALYLLPLGSIISSFKGVSYHCYADDIQLYVSFTPQNMQKINILLDCLAAIEGWMGRNFLQLNAAKTEVLIIASDSLAAKVKNLMGPLTTNVHPHIRNLGVFFDQAMNMDKHVSSLTRNCFFHIRNIAKLRSIVSHAELEMAVHAFISSRLDYCNSLFTCLSKASVHRLQLVQNAAARLITRSKKSCHITPILASLHWLPVHFRIQYKILIISYKALNGQAPAYISELIPPHYNTRSLRSFDQGLLAVPRTRLKTRGDRAFGAAAPRLWNALTPVLRSAPSLNLFKGHLKTHLFKQAFEQS